MRFITFGGGSQIGASTSFLELDGLRFLIDVGARSGSQFKRPNYDALLRQAGLKRAADLDALLVTHAHQDHIGGLPDFLSQAPSVPVYFHAHTGRVAGLFFSYWMDSVDVAGFADGSRLHDVYVRNEGRQYGEPFTISARGQHVEITLFPAGHLPGATCIRVRGQEGKLLITGDFNDQSSLFLEGVHAVPAIFDEHFDFLVAEATYAGRAPLSGPGIIAPDSLGATVAAILRRGGTVLIPSSPLGRAQEVLALLARDLPEDFLNTIPLWLETTIGKYMALYEELFASRKREAWFQKLLGWVQSQSDKEPPLDRPSVILAPPGMLKWTSPAGKMALHVLADPRNALILVGHQLEHTPGALLESVAVTGRSPFGLSVNGQYLRLRASIYRCTLTGHATSSGLMETLNKVKSSHVLLVHRHENRAGIDRFVKELDHKSVLLPSEEDIVEWSPSTGIRHVRLGGGAESPSR